jgi:pyridoxamine 5'-phosphate oxidase
MLSEVDLDPDPFRQFARWHTEAGSPPEMALCTASPAGEPAARMVLLKGVDDGGFVFFTNYGSAKARNLDANPRAALLFHWPPHRQVRVRGGASRVSAGESDAYWATRPRGSQLGAWASRQSQVIASRAELERRVVEVAATYPGDIPRPPHWGGFRVVPAEIEFWHHRDDRLHDRMRYRRADGRWVIERLSP